MVLLTRGAFKILDNVYQLILVDLDRRLILINVVIVIVSLCL